MIDAAIVGLGWWGKHIVRRMRDSERMRIVAAVESNPALRPFAEENGLDFMDGLSMALADPRIDAVILATPHSMHTRQVIEAAGAGKHVFCEKPLALTRADAQRSVEACRAAGVRLGIGHERRFEAGMSEIRRLVREGALGTILHAQANFSHDKLANVPKGDWRTSPADAPAAGMTAMGIHLTDAFLDLFGPIEEVYAKTARRVLDQPNGDIVTVEATFASGATGYLNAIMVTPLYIGFTVFGSEAWIEVRNHTHPDTPGPTTVTVQYRDGRREVRDYEWSDTVKANLEAFADTVETGAPYPFTDEQKIGNIAVLEAICRSAARNAPVRLADLEGAGSPATASSTAG